MKMKAVKEGQSKSSIAKLWLPTSLVPSMFFAALLLSNPAAGQESQALSLENHIPLPNVKGRPFQRRGLPMSGKSGCCFFFRRRSKMIETQTVPSDARKQPAVRRRPVEAPVLARCIAVGINRRPLRTPQRIHSRNAVET